MSAESLNDDIKKLASSFGGTKVLLKMIAANMKGYEDLSTFYVTSRFSFLESKIKKPRFLAAVKKIAQIPPEAFKTSIEDSFKDVRQLFQEKDLKKFYQINRHNKFARKYLSDSEFQLPLFDRIQLVMTRVILERLESLSNMAKDLESPTDEL
jgi:hypothetical protein